MKLEIWFLPALLRGSSNIYNRNERTVATLRLFHYFWDVSTVEEIERAVEKLPRKDFAKLAAWMGQHQAAAAGHCTGPAVTLNADWFDIYMTCPHSFRIPPRQKQFYRPKE
jgi:hypothetical protein